MKTCPVCKTSVFDDMDACYGCMHRFDEPQSASGERFAPAPEPSPPVASRSLYDEGRFGQTTWKPEPLMRPLPGDAGGPGGGDTELAMGCAGGAQPLAGWNDEGDLAVRAQHWARTKEPNELGAEPMPEETADGRWKVRLEVRVASSPPQVWSAEFSPSVFAPASALGTQDCSVS